MEPHWFAEPKANVPMPDLTADIIEDLPVPFVVEAG